MHPNFEKSIKKYIQAKKRKFKKIYAEIRKSGGYQYLYWKKHNNRKRARSKEAIKNMVKKER